MNPFDGLNPPKSTDTSYLARESEKHPVMLMIRTKADDNVAKILGDEKFSIFKNNQLIEKESKIVKYKSMAKASYSIGKIKIREYWTKTKLLTKTGLTVLDSKIFSKFNSIIDFYYSKASYEIDNKAVLRLKQKQIKEEERKAKFEAKAKIKLEKELKNKNLTIKQVDIKNKIEKQVNKSNLSKESFIDKKWNSFTSRVKAFFFRYLQFKPIPEQNLLNLYSTSCVSNINISSIAIANIESPNYNFNELLYNIIEEKKANNLSSKLLQRRRINNFFRLAVQIRPTFILEKRDKKIIIENKSAESIFYKAYTIIKSKSSIKSLSLSLMAFYFIYNKSLFNKVTDSSNSNNSLINKFNLHNFGESVLNIFNNRALYKTKLEEIKIRHPSLFELAHITEDKENNRTEEPRIIKFKEEELFKRIKIEEINVLMLLIEGKLNGNILVNEPDKQFKNISIKQQMLTAFTMLIYLSWFGGSLFYLLNIKSQSNNSNKLFKRYIRGFGVFSISTFVYFNVFWLFRTQLYESMKTNLAHNYLKSKHKQTLAYLAY